MMFSRSLSLLLLALAGSEAFVTPKFAAQRTVTLNEATTAMDPGLSADIRREINYKPGAAETTFAKKYGHLVGSSVRTVGEAFAEFTKELGTTVNPLYKGMVTDTVGTTHLIVVNARFTRDPVWSLGILTALDLLLKNYPEQEIGTNIVSALFKSVGLDEAEIRAEAQTISSWAEGKSREDVEAALQGEGSSPLASIANGIKGDEYWMYSRYFGIGVLKIMETVGVEMDKDEVYPIMESWISDKLGRSHLTACADSDLYFKIKEKLDMMETMMKEIEIREKKRLAERLEGKAEEALRQADKEVKMQNEIAAEASKQRERVASE
jgi:hypothetical protein